MSISSASSSKGSSYGTSANNPIAIPPINLFLQEKIRLLHKELARKNKRSEYGYRVAAVADRADCGGSLPPTPTSCHH